MRFRGKIFTRIFKSNPISSIVTPTIIIVCLLTTAYFAYVGRQLYGFTFVQDFISNWLATLLGVFVGIPIAVWTTGYQDRIIEKERKRKILLVLQEELFINHNILTSWKKSKEQDLELLTLGAWLKDESWRAFSDGGELRWIKNERLLRDLSWAYGMIRTINYQLERYFAYMSLGEARRDKREGIQYIRKDLVHSIDEACRIMESIDSEYLEQLRNGY